MYPLPGSQVSRNLAALLLKMLSGSLAAEVQMKAILPSCCCKFHFGGSDFAACPKSTVSAPFLGALDG